MLWYLGELLHKHLLFLPRLYGPLETMQVTSFFVRRSVYFAFFGQALTTDLSQAEHESSHVPVFVPPGRRCSSVELQAVESEERERRENLARLTRETQEQQEKLSNLSAKCRDCEARLQQLTQTELAIRKRLQEQQEQQERERRLEREPGQVAEVGQEREAIRGEEQLRWAPLAAPRETPSISPENSEDASRLAKQTRRVTQFEFGQLLETETPPHEPVKPLQGTVSEPTLSEQVGPSTVRSSSPIRIEFKTRARNNEWVTSDILHVDPSDPSEVQRVAAKYLRKNFHLFDTEYNNLIPRTCFGQATRNGTNTILVIPVSEVNTTWQKGLEH